MRDWCACRQSVVSSSDFSFPTQAFSGRWWWFRCCCPTAHPTPYRSHIPLPMYPNSLPYQGSQGAHQLPHQGAQPPTAPLPTPLPTPYPAPTPLPTATPLPATLPATAAVPIPLPLPAPLVPPHVPIGPGPATLCTTEADDGNYTPCQSVGTITKKAGGSLTSLVANKTGGPY
jgi:hypothetical protein